MRFEGTSGYVASDDLKVAVVVSPGVLSDVDDPDGRTGGKDFS